MQIIKNKDKLGRCLFIIGIMIELLVMVTDYYTFFDLPYRGRLTHLAFVCFLIKILMTNYSILQWECIVLGGILGTISYLTCGDEYVIRAVVFIVASKEINVKKVLSIIWYGAVFGTISIISLACLGIAGNIKTVADFGRGGVETRYVFGFNHANNLHDMIWYILALTLLLTHDKWKLKHYFLATIGNIGVFFLTASRNGMITIQILLITCCLIHYIPKINYMKTPYLLGGAGLLLCYWMTWLGGRYGILKNELVAFFDKFLNGRLEMVWEYGPVSAWKIFPEGRNLLHVDNGFGMLFYLYGYGIGISYIIVLLYMLYCLYKKGDGVAGCVLVTTFFITFIESTFIFNTSLLCNMAFVVMINRWYLGREKNENIIS